MREIILATLTFPDQFGMPPIKARTNWQQPNLDLVASPILDFHWDLDLDLGLLD